MRLLFGITFITILTILNGQNVNDKIFIDYEYVINEIKSKEINNTIELKYRYDFILLLDSSEILLIEKINSYDVEQFRKSAPGLVFNENIVGFITEKKDIKDIFLSNDLKSRIINCTNTHKSPDIKYEKIDFPIYIKENLVVFSISGPTWTQVYFAELKSHTLQINKLYSIIE